jgi:hypothetical protein
MEEIKVSDTSADLGIDYRCDNRKKFGELRGDTRALE